MPQLLLQKPSKSSKSKDLRALESRLELWEAGEFVQLFDEASTIQSSFKDSFRPKTVNEFSKRFLKEMQRGNVNGAIKILTNSMRNGVYL